MTQTPQHNSLPTRIVIGTRGSALALWQANAVQASLTDRFPDLEVELRIIKPEGDIDKQSSLLTIGGRGVFASALQEALLAGEIDLAVHSTKDVPTIEPVGLVIAAFPEREDARDAVVSRHGVGLRDLPPSPVIGTSSRRRAVQVQALRPDARIIELRGNIDTRLRKAESTDYDAVILAAAGLSRMGWQDRITEYLPFDRFVPAPGQGALAIETRIDPDPAYAIAHALNQEDVAMAVGLERAFLRAMGGGCTTPIGAHIEIERDNLHLWAMVAADDGSEMTQQSIVLPRDIAAQYVHIFANNMTSALGRTGPGVQQNPLDLSHDRPLVGKQVVVTGTHAMTDRLAGLLMAEGATVIESPTLEIRPTSAPDTLAAELSRAAEGEYDWIILTSQQSLPALAAFGPERFTNQARIAAVGLSTAQAIRDIGLVVDLVPEVQDGGSLVRSLAGIGIHDARILCLLGNTAGSTVPDGLATAGATVTRVESYQSLAVDEITAETRAKVRAGRVDIVIFSSPLSVHTFVTGLGVDLAALSGACLVAIGNSTSVAMDRSGLPVHVVADKPSPEGVVAACKSWFAARRGMEVHA